MFRASRFSSAAFTGLCNVLLNRQFKAVASKLPTPYVPHVSTSTIVAPSAWEALFAPSLYSARSFPSAIQKNPNFTPPEEATAWMEEFNAVSRVKQIRKLSGEKDKIMAIGALLLEQTDLENPVRLFFSNLCVEIADLLKVTADEETVSSEKIDEQIRRAYTLAIELAPYNKDIKEDFAIWRAMQGDTGDGVATLIWNDPPVEDDKDAPPKAKP